MIQPLAALLRLHELKTESEGKSVAGEVSLEIGRLQQALPASLQQRYANIRVRYGQGAIVPLRRGVCTGCNMHHPAASKKIVEGISQCQNCHRLVYDSDEAYDLCVG